MNRIEIKAKIELFRRELRALEAIGLSCKTCEHGSRSNWCEKFHAVPPADVTPVGCDDWLHDQIPF